MKSKLLSLMSIIFFTVLYQVNGDTIEEFADSIRLAYNIPEIGYAVVSSTKILELQLIGIKRINSTIQADINDRFRIGSNTKAITGFIAGLLVNQNKISWNTKFFDLFPELRTNSKKAYYDMTLLNLLSFRTKLFSYTYTNKKPTKEQFTGNEEEQRFQFIKWFLQQKPVSGKNKFNISNLGYIAAGLMLEKASGKSYKELVKDLGTQLGINFGFGLPNQSDSLQPWGHNEELVPESPGDNYKFDLLQAAGNINISLPDYSKFIQLQLLGLKGKSELLSENEFNFLHYGLPRFSVGWFCEKDKNNQTFSYNIGDPGTFLSMVYVFKSADKAIILFSNSQSENTEKGLNLVLKKLKKVYGIK